MNAKMAHRKGEGAMNVCTNARKRLKKRGMFRILYLMRFFLDGIFYLLILGVLNHNHAGLWGIT